jgi:hypothetical protein
MLSSDSERVLEIKKENYLWGTSPPLGECTSSKPLFGRLRLLYLLVNLAGLICVPLVVCSRYAFSRNDPLPEQRGKAYGCTLSAQTEQKN